MVTLKTKSEENITGASNRLKAVFSTFHLIRRGRVLLKADSFDLK